MIMTPALVLNITTPALVLNITALTLVLIISALALVLIFTALALVLTSLVLVPFFALSFSVSWIGERAYRWHQARGARGQHCVRYRRRSRYYRLRTAGEKR